MLRRLIFEIRIFISGNLRLYSDFRKFKKQYIISKDKDYFVFDKKSKVIKDWFSEAGTASGHYFHQDLFVAQEIYQSNPVKHYDIGSRVDGFISHLAVFREVTIFDIRTIESTTPNIKFIQLDIMDRNQVSNMEKVTSLSCLHTAEHFGLGRYGDPINFDGWKDGIDSMTSMLESGGIFYFSTPISDRQRIVFNAHRIFNPSYLTKFFEENFEVIKTAAVRDSGDLDLDVDFTSSSFMLEFKDHYACGIWVLKKK